MVRLFVVICLVSYGYVDPTFSQSTHNQIGRTTNISPCEDHGECVYPCSVGAHNPGDIIIIRSRATTECSCTCPQVSGQGSVYKINDGCGYRNEVNAHSTRILGVDNVSEYNEFPWIVVVMSETIKNGKSGNDYLCVGSLIHPSVVLTAAHCVIRSPEGSLKIRAGEWDLQTNDETFPHQDRKVEECIIHEHFHKRLLLNDIALLFLAEPVDITDNVNTVCLPPQNQNSDLQRCFVSGWGKNMFGPLGSYQTFLKTVEVPVVPRYRCLMELRTRLGEDYELPNSFICAGGEIGRDTCTGDGGAPLVCPVPNTINTYHQIGIVSWGIGCGTSIPGAYVNVALFRKWIEGELYRKANPKKCF